MEQTKQEWEPKLRELMTDTGINDKEEAINLIRTEIDSAEKRGYAKGYTNGLTETCEVHRDRAFSAGRASALEEIRKVISNQDNAFVDIEQRTHKPGYE